MGAICQHQRQVQSRRYPTSEAVAHGRGMQGPFFGCVTCSAPVAALMSCRLPPQEPFDVLPPHLSPGSTVSPTVARAPKGRAVHGHQRPSPACEPSPLTTTAWARRQAGAGSALAPACYCRSYVPVLAHQVTLGQLHWSPLPSTQQPRSNLPLLPASTPLTLFRLEAQGA